MIDVRQYREDELAAVVDLFTAAVHIGAADHYDARRRSAWAPRPPDLEQWRGRLRVAHTLVADIAGELAGFVTFQMNGHIDLLFTSPRFTRRGVARALYREVESVLVEAGVAAAFTEASRMGRLFFEAQGFSVVATETVIRGEVSLERFAMRKSLGRADPDSSEGSTG